MRTMELLDGSPNQHSVPGCGHRQTAQMLEIEVGIRIQTAAAESGGVSFLPSGERALPSPVQSSR